ncbi:MAG: hypothetical protein GX489_08885 [Firmicutes bacterium]|nr:hypothetical protein [Bacillota bacterium]
MLFDFIQFTKDYCDRHPQSSKGAVAAAVAAHFNLQKDRSLYVCSSFAVRFSYSSSSSFSNVVLSLKKLHQYDDIPVVVVVVRPTGVEFLLANSTFIKKISHSSHRLTTDNICGSFLGNDIIREYDGIPNRPERFEELFNIHQEFTWQENLERIVEATNNIAATNRRFTPTDVGVANILRSAELARDLCADPEYQAIGTKLQQIVIENRDAILQAAAIDNVNLRGNKIEQIITQGGNSHGLQDSSVTLSSGVRILIDIKSKMLDAASAPKAYNIDKFLETLASGNTVVSFFFVGVDRTNSSVVTALTSVLDASLLDATRVQFHWAGRNSRGVTQLTGDWSTVFTEPEQVDVNKAQEFLNQLIKL